MFIQQFAKRMELVYLLYNDQMKEVRPVTREALEENTTVSCWLRRQFSVSNSKENRGSLWVYYWIYAFSKLPKPSSFMIYRSTFRIQICGYFMEVLISQQVGNDAMYIFNLNSRHFHLFLIRVAASSKWASQEDDPTNKQVFRARSSATTS